VRPSIQKRSSPASSKARSAAQDGIFAIKRSEEGLAEFTQRLTLEGPGSWQCYMIPGMRQAMFDAQRYLAALVYDEHQDPDAVLRDFAADLKARGYRAIGMVQAGQCADSSLSAVLLHNGEKLLLAQDFDPAACGCRLDVGRLQSAAARIDEALEAGADLLVINRFGKREQEGKGLGYLIERALEADTPVVIAVSSNRFTDWKKFAGMSVKLACNRHALETWWCNVSRRSPESRQTISEILK
jgi:nucleoside-triphosphatase THEP1